MTTPPHPPHTPDPAALASADYLRQRTSPQPEDQFYLHLLDLLIVVVDIIFLLLAGTGAGRVCRQSGGSAQGRQAGRWAGKWHKQSYCKQLHREP